MQQPGSMRAILLQGRLRHTEVEAMFCKTMSLSGPSRSSDGDIEAARVRHKANPAIQIAAHCTEDDDISLAPLVAIHSGDGHLAAAAAAAAVR